MGEKKKQKKKRSKIQNTKRVLVPSGVHKNRRSASKLLASYDTCE